MYVEHLDGPEVPTSLGCFSQTIRYVKGGADAAEASEELALFTLDEQLIKESKPFGVGGVAVTRAAAPP